VCLVCERRAEYHTPISVESRLDVRRHGRGWAAPLRYANAGSLDMSWLPLPRFESRVVRVAVCGLGARGEGTAPNIRALEVAYRRERWVFKYAPSDDHRQETQIRSLAAVRALV
jgi:hypothetical protein